MGALTLAVLLSAAADAATTDYALRHGMRESNPMVRAYVGERPSMVWALKGASAVGVLYVANSRPKGQRTFIKLVTASLWTAAAARNFYRIRTR